MREECCTCGLCGLEQRAALPAQCCNCKAWMYYPDDDEEVAEDDEDDEVS